MKLAEITEWVTLLDQAHELVRGVRDDARTNEDAERMAARALAALGELYERMLRAEIRAVIAKTTG